MTDNYIRHLLHESEHIKYAPTLALPVVYSSRQTAGQINKYCDTWEKNIMNNSGDLPLTVWHEDVFKYLIN